MSTVDSFQDERVAEAALKLATARGASKSIALQLAQTLITQDDNAWLATLLSQRRVKVHIYSASSDAKRAHRRDRVQTARGSREKNHGVEGRRPVDSSWAGLCGKF